MSKNNNIKPDITYVKIFFTVLVTFFVILALIETFTSEPNGGFKNSPTPANPRAGFELIGVSMVIPVQLLLHYYFTFKHWIIVNVVYYVTLVLIFVLAGFVSLTASI